MQLRVLRPEGGAPFPRAIAAAGAPKRPRAAAAAVAAATRSGAPTAIAAAATRARTSFAAVASATRARRAFALLAFAAAALAGPGAAPAEEPSKLTVVVVVVDSLMPDEIGQSFPQTPNLTLLRDSGTSYAHSRAVFSAETIPNHVAMMTGVLPERSGIAANSYWNRSGTPEVTDLSLPSELDATTLFTRIRQECPNLKTAAALSKDYLYEIFSECGYSGTACGINEAPDQSFDPSADPTFIPVSNHTPDLRTMSQARTFLPDADFLFVNLGDVDRSGHVDETGNTGSPLARWAALMDTDALIGQLIDELDAAGRWENTVMIVVSDHGMDWSTPDKYVNLTPELPSGLFAAQNGGTAGVFVVDPADPARDEKLAAARSLALMHEGVEAAWYREPNPLDPGEATLIPAQLGARHENIGDLVVVAKQGWRISESSSTSNPLPGNHGHLATFHNTFLVAGGLPSLRIQTVGNPADAVSPLDRLPAQSENTDVAATVAWLFGMEARDMDGRALTEAFTTSVPPSLCGVLADGDADGEPDYRDPCPTIPGGAHCICPAAPEGGCRQATKRRSSKLSVRADGDASSLRFALKRGAASSFADFRDEQDEALSLCVYSEAGPWPRLLSEQRLPFDLACGDAGCWTEARGTKLLFENEDGLPDGITEAQLATGDAGKTKIVVEGRTALAAPLDVPVRVQLQSHGGSCWDAAFDDSGIRRNEDGRFDAVSR